MDEDFHQGNANLSLLSMDDGADEENPLICKVDDQVDDILCLVS